MERIFEVPDNPPESLLEAFRMRERILFVGDDLSEAAGYPSWEQFITGLLDWSMDNEIIDPNFYKSLSKSTSAEDMDYAADWIANQVRVNQRQADLVDYLKSVFLSPDHPGTPVHIQLGKLPFAGVVTPNYDDHSERSLVESYPLDIYTVYELARTADGRQPWLRWETGKD